MMREKGRIEAALDCRISYCRQHWLRFAWKTTWRAQADAGLSTDMTLGFNDQPGFRMGAALALRPRDWHGEQVPITIWPMVLMDSHIYDYLSLEPSNRTMIIDELFDEIEFVGGQASVIWHTHVLGRDYGWIPEFEYLIQRASKANPT